MTEELSGDSRVSWTAAQLFDKFELKMGARFDSQDLVLTEIDRRIDGTATKQDVADLRIDLTNLGQRVTSIEVSRREEATIKTHKMRTWKVIAAILGIMAGIGTAVGTLVLVL